MPIAKGNYHPDKDIDGAIRYALENGWRWVEKGTSHSKGVLYCTVDSTGIHETVECFIPVFSTPKSPTNHAKKIRKAVDGHSC